MNILNKWVDFPSLDISANQFSNLDHLQIKTEFTPVSTDNISQFFPPGSDPTGQGTGSFKDEYNAATKYAGFVTHSEFEPYLTTVGLYNDSNELLVVGKLAKPIKLSKETQTSIVVRFDV